MDYGLISNSNKTEWSSIRSDIIRVITNRTTVQWECDFFVASMITDRIEPNEAPINHKNYNFREKKNHSQVVEERKKNLHERELRLLRQVSLELIAIMPRLQTRLLPKENIYSNLLLLFMAMIIAFNFWRAPILDVMASLCCPVVSGKRTSASTSFPGSLFSTSLIVGRKTLVVLVT